LNYSLLKRRRNEHDFVIIAPNFVFNRRDIQQNFYNNQQKSIDEEDCDKDADTRSTTQSNATSCVNSGANVSNDQNRNNCFIECDLMYSKELRKNQFCPKTLPLIEKSHQLNNHYNRKYTSTI
jgi:hypothetical protein